MTQRQPLGRPGYALGVVALGILDLVYRDTLMWKVLPVGWPAPVKMVLALITGVLLIVTGAALLDSRFTLRASRVLTAFLFIWVIAIGIPPVLQSPAAEVTWLVLGMMTIVMVAPWLLTGTSRLRVARTVVGVALIPVGLSHFFYAQTTLNLVPTWMPDRQVWVYLAGAAHIAAGLGVLCSVYARLAARLEAGMLMAFAVLVWVPRVVTSPGIHFNWTELLGTWVVGAAVWVVADSYQQR